MPILASQLMAEGRPGFRPICGMGICFECRATVDGVAHQRTCQQAASTVLDSDAEIVVVGGGPAGIAAACAARESGRDVLLVDDNGSPGGQIWRGQPPPSPWAERIARADLRILSGTCVAGVLRYRKLILATGARERFLPFPGWTLPNVTGAGGLQAFVKGGLPIAGKRVVVAGTGPLLVAVAGYLRHRGARVVLVAEQASWPRLLRFTMALAGSPGKWAQSLGLATHRYLPGCWPAAAEGSDKLEAVVLSRGRKTWRERCDYLACGFGLVPNVELPMLLGCALRNGSVVTDEFQRTSIAGIYYAGDPGGVDLSLAEGEIAGYAAAGREDEARRLFASRARARRFRTAVDRAFALRVELKSLPSPSTVVCRCENVAWGALEPHRDWRSAKLETRCGMGPCQGRVCGAALAFLRGWSNESVRPPVFPCRLDTLL